MGSFERQLSACAIRAGFVLVGFARLERLADRVPFYQKWLAEGRHGEMAYLAREPERRFDPRTLDARLTSVISLAWPYAAPRPPELDWRSELRGRLASYALGGDYHETVIARAREVAGMLAEMRPAAVTRVYVDTGAVFEREWATKARLGWFGRNTNLLNRYHGSYFFLAEIFTSVEFDEASEPYREHCGSCRQCLDLCPTGALEHGYKIEPRLCISYLTIEHRGVIALELRPRMGNWIFGCDICQEVCPWNNDAQRAAAVNDELAPSLVELMELDEEGFRRRFKHSAIKRAKRRGLLRNCAIALGNSGNAAAVPVLARVIAHEPEALVRGHAAWALGHLGGAAAKEALERARAREPDPGVAGEIDLALASTA
ncbi:MAG: tRNA epoxyqueuosine(34) reductase QueG [Candidatus Binataceae bacterium]